MKTFEEAKEIFKQKLKEYIDNCSNYRLTQLFYSSGPEGKKRAEEFLTEMNACTTLKELIQLVTKSKFQEGKNMPKILRLCLFEIAEVEDFCIDYMAEARAKELNQNSVLKNYTKDNHEIREYTCQRLYGMITTGTCDYAQSFLESLKILLKSNSTENSSLAIKNY